MKQDSLRSMGRRGGCIKLTDSSPLDIHKLFENAKINFKNRKVNPFSQNSYLNYAINDEKISKYDFKQASNKWNLDKDLLKFRSRRLSEITSKLNNIKRDSDFLLEWVKKESQNLKKDSFEHLEY